MAVPYTTGNWTVSRVHTGSGTAKNYSLPKIDFAQEFASAAKPKERKVSNDQEAYFVSSASGSLASAGSLIEARDRVSNIYTDKEYDASAQLAQKNGVKAYNQLTLYYSATNSVSGQECYFPLSGSISVNIPASAIVTTDALYDFVSYLVSSLFAKDSTSPDNLASILRGDLDPTR